MLDGPFEVTPSATSWVTAHQAVIPSGPNLVVHGPGLEHAAAEAARIAHIAGASSVSTVAEAAVHLPAAGLAHFACHARPRLDSPMFSSLVLADGELTLYDIEQTRRAPGVVILAACEGGSSVIASGEEVMGLATAFLRLGARTVIAPLFEVSDAATAVVMDALHRALRGGADPAEALAGAGATASDPVAVFTARCFAVFGSA